MKKYFNNIYIYTSAFLLTSRVLDFEKPIALYYGVIILLLVRYFYNPRKIRLFDKSMLIFVAILFISILFNTIPAFFRVNERFISFLLIILVFSPLLVTDRINAFRESTFRAIGQMFVVYTFISFSGLLVGFYPLIGHGGFQGVTSHAMTMSIVAAVSTLYLFAKYRDTQKKLYLIFTLISFVVIIIAASRAALLGTVIGVLGYLYKDGMLTFRSSYKIVIVFFGVFLLLTSLPEEYYEIINRKFTAASENENIIYSRKSLWESKIKEFKDSPIYGIGFSNVNVNYENKFDIETGIIEPGTSWGAVLSMSGLLGFLTFLFMATSRFRAMFRSTNLTENNFIFSLFIFFLVHLVFEGYIFASGSVFMLLFWLTYFMSYRLKDTKQ